MKRLALVLGLAVGWWAGARRARRQSTERRPDAVEFDFLSLMSHELKTPVNIILGYLELLEGGVPDPLPSPAREHVRHARVAAVRLAHLLNDLLTWTRLESGRAVVHPQAVTAAAIVRDACGPLMDQADAGRIRLEIDAPADMGLRTDPSRACQALRALVANALKFTEAGSVRVSVERTDGRVRFHVRDTGIGISPEHMETMFQPYWQLDTNVRRTRGGVGIGLTVARQLARLLGGDVTAHSIPGTGSEFVLELPDIE